MRVSLAVILMLVSLASPAYAQQTAIEQRVSEELASDGMSLRPFDVSLDIEMVGDKALLSLVDNVTGRVRASTKVDGLPGQHEAAVASLVVVAGNLVVQLAEPSPRVIDPPSSAPLLDVPDPAAGSRHHRRLARIAFWTSGLAALATAGVIALGAEADRQDADMRPFNAAIGISMAVCAGALGVGLWQHGLAVSGRF